MHAGHRFTAIGTAVPVAQRASEGFNLTVPSPAEPDSVATASAKNLAFVPVFVCPCLLDYLNASGTQPATHWHWQASTMTGSARPGAHWHWQAGRDEHVSDSRRRVVTLPLAVHSESPAASATGSGRGAAAMVAAAAAQLQACKRISRCAHCHRDWQDIIVIVR